MIHRSTDGYPVEIDRQFWNNDLRVVKITGVAVSQNAYADSGEIQTWHQTPAGRFDTMSGSLSHTGRLSRYYRGKDAQEFPPGMSFSEIR